MVHRRMHVVMKPIVVILVLFQLCSADRQTLASNIMKRFNVSKGLLMGAHAGGNGFQWYGYSILDENYFAAKALHAFNVSLADLLQRNVDVWLAKPASKGWELDRRENMWGARGSSYTGTCSQVGGDCKIYGSYTPDPPLAGENVFQTSFAVYSELNNNNTYTIDFCVEKAKGDNVNHCGVLALALVLQGDISNAHRVFDRMLSTWDGIGFDCGSGDYNTRSVAYFLFMQRALSSHYNGSGFELPEGVRDTMEGRLWWTQQCDSDGAGLPPRYTATEAKCPPREGDPAMPDQLANTQVTSIETNALALLATDVFGITTDWWPSAGPSPSPAPTPVPSPPPAPGSTVCHCDYPGDAAPNNSFTCIDGSQRHCGSKLPCSLAEDFPCGDSGKWNCGQCDLPAFHENWI